MTADATTILLAEHAESIRRLARRTVADMVEIGERLIAVKKLLPHGQWTPWVKKEFDWEIWTATRFMQVARAFGGASKTVTVTDLSFDTQALYLLANNKAPESARAKAIEYARAGERITPLRALDIIQHERGALLRAKPEPQPKSEPKIETDPWKVRLQMLKDLQEVFCALSQRIPLCDIAIRSPVVKAAAEQALETVNAHVRKMALAQNGDDR
jgi:hypothetical protein